MIEKPRLTILQIVNMSIGFMGIQFGWGLQMANMSAIYEYLGANPDKIPILWLAAPLTGLIVQPIIGHMSDNTWCWLGRRRPYFLVGALFAVMALFLMPYSGILWMAAGLLWILDTSVNVSMEPFRAFVADKLPEEQRTLGYSIQTLFVSIGAVTASAFPWILHHFFGVASTGPVPNPAGQVIAGSDITDELATPVFAFFNFLPESLRALLTQIFQDRLPLVIKYAFHVGAVVFLLAILWTIATCREYPPDNMEEFKKRKKSTGGVLKFFKEIGEDLIHMPKTMRELAWVQFFSWMALFCMWMYYPVTVGHLFGKEGTPGYLEGIEWAGLCFACYNVVSLIYAFLMPKIAEKISRKGTHILSLLLGAAGFLGILLINGSSNVSVLKWYVMALMIGIGAAWGSILTMPYAMLSTAIPKEKMGIYMGIFNFFITIPQIVTSLGFGWVMFHLLHNNRALGVAFGGVCMVIAALLTIRVTDAGSAKQIGQPHSWVAPTKANK